MAGGTPGSNGPKRYPKSGDTDGGVPYGNKNKTIATTPSGGGDGFSRPKGSDATPGYKRGGVVGKAKPPSKTTKKRSADYLHR